MKPYRSVPFSVDLGIAIFAMLIGIGLLLLILVLALQFATPHARGAGPSARVPACASWGPACGV